MDRNKDKVDDRHYAGVNCLESGPAEGYLDTCMGNGGIDDKVGSGILKGDPGYVDNNKDGVDDHF